jgi:hypothetical protein
VDYISSLYELCQDFAVLTRHSTYIDYYQNLVKLADIEFVRTENLVTGDHNVC